jgi:hypothetical protein
MGKRNLPEKLTDDNVLDPEFFREDLEEMYSSIEDMDEYIHRIDNDLKDKYFDSENRSLYGKGTLAFSSKQMETLASLHAGKNNAINQALRGKLDISKMALAKKKNNESAVDAELVAREFQRLFMENKDRMFSQQRQFEEQARIAQNTPLNDQHLDSRINDLLQSGKMKLSDNEIAIRYEKRDVQIRVQSLPEPHFVAVAGDNGEILTNYPPTLLPNATMLASAVFENGVWHCGNGNDFYSL